MDKRYMALGASMMVLELLEQQSMYGYRIIEELEQQNQQVPCLQEDTLYPILHGLEQQGAVTGVQKIAKSGRTRRYYEITKRGRKVFAEETAEWQVYRGVVNRVIGGEAFS